jgi:hypothetical protein
MLKSAVRPPPFIKSAYGPEPRAQRAADLPGFASVSVRELFPDIVPAIYRDQSDLAAIRQATERALSGVDMSMIRPGDTVNVASCEHGFSIMGGWPYAEMLKTIRDVIRERTGCRHIRLRVGAWQGYREAAEGIEQLGLEKHYGKGRATGFGPTDKGVAIETAVGTFYGIQRVYDATWFIHAYYDDAREIYLHRYLYRPFKAFMMAYARQETRGLLHMYPNRSGNFLHKAVFESPFVQQRYAFTCLLRSSPAGITGIEADRDLYKINRHITRDHLRDYGKMLKLFTAIDECIPIIDGGRWLYYIPAGGLTFCELLYGTRDHLDLSNPYTTAQWDIRDPDIMALANPAIKALVINQMWRGIPCAGITWRYPTFLVGQDLTDMFAQDASSPGLVDAAITADSLEKAVEWAKQAGGTDRLIAFDGSFGHINVSPSMGDFLIRKAPEVARETEAELPKWLKQRGLSPESPGASGSQYSQSAGLA